MASMEPDPTTPSSKRRRIKGSTVTSQQSSLEGRIQRLRHSRIYEFGQPLYIQPMAKATLQASDDALFPLMDRVKEFIAGEKHVMLILGDSGIGKSTFNRQLEYELWQRYTTGDPIPLLINLPALERPEKDLVAEPLSQLDFSWEEISQLKQNHDVILICDGYDESQLTSNLYTSNLLNCPGQWNVKLIISCRAQYLGPDYRSQFVPTINGQNLYDTGDRFQEAVIAPFSRSQIEDYVQRYVPLEPRPWVNEDYMRMLTTVPNLMELTGNPFLLTLALEALPTVTQGHSDISRLQITRVQLYDSFVKHWLGANKRRLQDQRLDTDNTLALWEILEEGFIQNGVKFQTDLAAAIFQEQDGRPFVDYTQRRDGNSWKANFFGSDPDISLLRRASLLSRVGTQHRFLHRSILEYFYSCAIYGPANGNDEFTSPSLFDSSNIGDHPLSRRNLRTEPSVIQFLSERVQQYHIFKATLLNLVEQSKTDVTVATAAANAVTILSKTGFQFNGADFSDVRIPGADLSCVELDSVRFDGADLTGVNFSKSWLRQVIFDGALMSGVQLGERAATCSFSPDGQTLTIGMSDGVVNQWTTSTAVISKLRRVRTAFVSNIIFSANYQHIALGIENFSIRLWDVEAGQPLRDFAGHTGRVTSIAFSPDGLQLVSCAIDRSVRLWSMRTGSFDLILPDHTGSINSIVFSPNGLHIALTGSDGTCRIWDVQNHCAGAVLRGHATGVTAAAFSSCGSFIATGGIDKTIRTWNVYYGELQYTLPGHDRPITAIVYSSNGTRIASGSSDGVVRLWNSENGMPERVLFGHSLDITGLVFSPSGDLLISSSFDTTVRWWRIKSTESGVVLRGSSSDTESMEHTSVDSGSQDSESICTQHWGSQESTVGGRSKGQPSKVTGVAFSASGEHLFSGGYDGTLRSLNVQSAELQWAHRGHEGTVTAVACSLHGDVISASLDQTIALWDITKEKIARVFRGHEASVMSVSFTPCGQWMVSGSADWTVRVWELSSGTVIRNLVGHTQAVRSVATSPTGCQVASGGEDTTVRLWDLRSLGSEPMLLTGHTESVSCVAYSSDGMHVASASEDKTGRVWEATTGRLCFTLEGHTEGLLCVAFSSHGQWIATGGFDNTLRLWSTDCGRCLDVIDAFFGAVRSVSWSPDGTSFATGSDDKSIRVWRVAAENDGIKVQLQWGPGCDVIVASRARIHGAVGLSNVNRTLLLKHGAVDNGDDLERMEE